LVMGAKVTRERNLARQQAQITRQNLYAVDIALAYHALEADDYDVAWRSLVNHRPSSPPSALIDQLSTDLRGFEWRWLWHRAQGEARHNFAAHLGFVNTIAYSPDGRFVASASEDATAKLWDGIREQWLRTFEAPGNANALRTYTNSLNPYRMYSASLSPDSRTLLTGSDGLRLWEIKSGRCLWSLKTNGYNMAVFSPTDPNLALVTRDYPRTSLGLLELASQSLTAVFTNGRADAICFTPNGRHFACWDRDARRIWLQKVPSGETVASFDTTNIYVLAMALAPNGRTLAACNMEKGRVELFDVASQRKSEPLPGHGRRLRTLAISPDSRWLACGGYDQTIQLWDLDSRQEVRQFHGHRAAVYALAFSPDGRHLASGGYDGTVRFWDLVPPEPPPVITNVFGAFAFSSDGRWLVTQSNDRLTSLWELSARRVVRQWEAPRFQSASFVTNGSLLTASISLSNEPPSVRAFPLFSVPLAAPTRHAVAPSQRVEEGSGVRAAERKRADEKGLNSQLSTLNSQLLVGIPSPCSAIALSPNGLFTVTGHRDGTVAFWESPSGHLLHAAQGAFVGLAHQGNNDNVQIVAFSLDGRTVGAATFRRVCVNTWALPECRLLATRHFGNSYELPMAISPNGEHLAFGGIGQGLTINLWDRALRSPPAYLHGHQDFLFAVAYSPDGRTLASGGRDGLLKLWHLPTERQVGTVLALPKEIKFAQISFSPDGTWLGASDTSGALHLWHVLPLAELDAAADAEMVVR
jgi:WD40 repeat protein